LKTLVTPDSHGTKRGTPWDSFNRPSNGEMKMKEYEESEYDIPKNEAICFEDNCTCRYVFKTQSNKMAKSSIYKSSTMGPSQLFEPRRFQIAILL
jgi:hypothetical protein